MNSIVMIVFLQAGYAIRSGAMLRADFLAQRFPRCSGGLPWRWAISWVRRSSR